MRTLAHVQHSKSEVTLASEFEKDTNAVELIVALRAVGLSETASEQPLIPQIPSFILRPVTGLVDLNTASPELLNLLLEGYGLPQARINQALETFQFWRGEGRKLQRVSDFGRVSGLTVNELPDLSKLATVFSGRDGIAIDQAPNQLLGHLFGTSDGGAPQTNQIDQTLISSGSTSNFCLEYGNRSPVGPCFHFDGLSATSRFLAVR